MEPPHTPRRSARLRTAKHKRAPQNRGPEASTVTKNRFYHAIDTRGQKPQFQVIEEENVPRRTAYSWLKQRKDLGSPSKRRTRKLSDRLDRKPALDSSSIPLLLSTENPVRNQRYEAQIAHFDLPITVRGLQNHLQTHTNGVQLYKQEKIKKLSDRNRETRVQYGQEHKDHTIENYWQFVHFTDEKHVDPGQAQRRRILREPGTRYNDENLQETPDFQGVKLHLATSVSWHHKGELQWYNDEKDAPKLFTKSKAYKEPKPRKNMYESVKEYDRRVLDWEAKLPHSIEVKPKGNAMTQLYYTKRLLPYYLEQIQEANRQGRRAILQEDNDPSHGTRSNKRKALNPAQRFKNDNEIETLSHPARSPDLNPIEACWGILFTRVRKHTWNSIEEMKRIIEEEWKAIDQSEIQTRIQEMPERCARVVANGGKAIRQNGW